MSRNDIALRTGSKVYGVDYYGNKNTLVGTVTNIEGITYRAQPGYRGDDIITVVWDNGVTVRFYRHTVHKWDNS